MAGFRGDASFVRRGVRFRTVKAFPFERTSLEESVTGGKSFLEDVYSITGKLLIGISGDVYEELHSLTRIQIATKERTLRNFCEICEALIPLLYFGFLHKDLSNFNIRSLINSFLENWFDFYDTHDYESFIQNVEASYEKSNFASVFLLLFHYFDVPPVQSCETLLTWHSSETSAPQWLQKTLSCSENVYTHFNEILYKNLTFNVISFEVKMKRNYLLTYSKFLDACQKYFDENYKESITYFLGLNDVNCSRILISWKKLMIGLNFEHLRKYEQALLFYKEALVQYEYCYFALFFSARIFKEKDDIHAYFDCLKLLTEIGEGTESIDNSLHKFLLGYHAPLISNLDQRSKWLLASAYFDQKRWKDARDLCKEVLSNWKCVKQIVKFKILKDSDQFPNLPPLNILKLCYLASLINLEELQELTSCSFAVETDTSDTSDVVNIEYAEKVSNICTIICNLIVTEGLYRQEKYESALGKSGSVLLAIESSFVDSEPFSTLTTLTKIYLYKMLALLYSKHPLNMWKNSTHFSRLHDHSLKLLGNTLRDNTCPISDMVSKILKQRIEIFGIKLDDDFH